MSSLRKATMWLVLMVAVGAAGRAAAQSPPEPPSAPVHVFAQIGLGIVEIGHVEVGAFLGPHVTVEAMAAAAGVFGGRYGGGVFAVIGHAHGWRPPRHALLVGARLMLNSDRTFDSGGDNLSSYGVIPVGYGYLADNGVYFRTTIGLAIVNDRTTIQPASGGVVPTYNHEVAVAGPLLTASIGYAF